VHRVNSGFAPCARTATLRWLAAPLVIACLLNVATLPAIAVEPAEPEPLIASLTVNGVARGEQALLMTATGDFWIALADFVSLGLKPPAPGTPAAGAIRELNGARYISLGKLARTPIRFDEKNLGVDITLSTEFFDEQYFQSQSDRAPPVRFRSGDGAFLNYFATASEDRTSGSADAGPALRLSTELGAYVGPMFLRYESSLARIGGVSQYSRVATQAILDHVPTMTRVTIGDAFISTGPLGSSLAIGGLVWGTYYPMQPQLVRSPLASVAGNVETPSIVDVSIGGLPVTRQRVAPGAFEIRNIAYYGGARNLEVSVTDASGRVRRFEVPYYFSDTTLRQGLHDFNYAAGKIRTDSGDGNPQYGQTALFAYHHYGFTDSLTGGTRIESASKFAAGGIEASYRSDALGYFSMDLGASRDRQRQLTGRAVQFSYAYQTQLGGLRLAGRRLSDAYRTLAPLTDVSDDVVSAATKQEWRVTSYLNPLPSLFLSADFGFARSNAGASGHTTSVNVSYRFTPALNITGGIKRGNDPGNALATEAFLGLFWSLDPQTTAGASRRQTGSSSTNLASFNRAAPVGEGIGYRVDASRDDLDGVRSSRLQPRVQWNTPWATITGDGVIENTNGSGGRKSVSLAAAGGITLIGSQLAATRPIYDSYGLVELGIPLAGVRVYLNNQPVGSTDANGRLYIPSLSSFQENQVRIDHRDLPLEYAVNRMDTSVVPAFRAGVRIPFAAYRARALAGRIVYLEAGKAVALPGQRLMLKTSTGNKQISVDSGGEFYVEGIAPGHYRIDARHAGTSCAVNLVVPDNSDVFVELKEALICE
jgi:outer membrane usher protein